MSRCVAVLMAMLAATTARAAGDACTVVQASLDKLATTATMHQWFSKTDAPPWQRITIKDTMYLMVEENGVWTEMPAEADQTLTSIPRMLASATRTCARGKRARIDGASCVHYVVQDELGDQSFSKSDLCIDRKSGLPVQHELEERSTFKRTQTTVRYDYKKVVAPK
jgi:hypothetical protein